MAEIFSVRWRGIRQVPANTVLANITGAVDTVQAVGPTDFRTWLGVGSVGPAGALQASDGAGASVDSGATAAAGAITGASLTVTGTVLANQVGNMDELDRVVFRAGASWNTITERQMRDTAFGFQDGYPCIRSSSQFALVGRQGVCNVPSPAHFGFSSAASASADVRLFRDGVGQLALRYGLSPQSLAVYGSYTDGGNYERLRIYGQTGNHLVLSSEAAGTGVLRRLQLAGAPVEVEKSLKTGGQSIVSAGGAESLDLDASNKFQLELQGDVTLSVVNVDSDQPFSLRTVMDGTGGHSLTWFAGITWDVDPAPVVTSTAGAEDWFVFYPLGGGLFRGFVIKQDI